MGAPRDSAESSSGEVGMSGTLKRMGRPNVSCDAVADFFLVHVDVNAGELLSNLKLQKLCYYSQAWHLALFSEPLFCERIEAWAHGPVSPALYHRFRNYKWNPIEPSDIVCNPFEILNERQISLLEEIWEKYGGLSAKALEILTHREDPWAKAYGSRPIGSACTNEISQESMMKYYRGISEKNGAHSTPAC